MISFRSCSPWIVKISTRCYVVEFVPNHRIVVRRCLLLRFILFCFVTRKLFLFVNETSASSFGRKNRTMRTATELTMTVSVKRITQ